jgi:hypothetical protein
MQRQISLLCTAVLYCMQKESRAALIGAGVLLALVIGVIVVAGTLYGGQGDRSAVLSPTPSGSGPAISPTIAGGIPNRGSFTFSISPQTAQARPGQTLTYTMDILPVDGYNGTVHVTLVVSALFVTRDYDLGTYEPPYPRHIEYPMMVPGSIPSGITLEGKVTAQGGGTRKVETIHLRVV